MLIVVFINSTLGLQLLNSAHSIDSLVNTPKVLTAMFPSSV